MRVSSTNCRKLEIANLCVALVSIAFAAGCNKQTGSQTAKSAAPTNAAADKPTVPIALQDTPNPNQALIQEIETNFAAWQEGKPFDFKPAAAKVAKLLEAGLDQQSYELVPDFARACEGAGSYEAAKQLYTALQKAAGKSDNPRLAFSAKEVAASGLSRLALLGTTPKIDTNVFGGSKFDLDKYKGKVVLLDFWATWCGPCLAELPNVKKVYEQLHNQGFDVVGISLDEDKETLAKFLDKERLPWATLFEEDPAKQGWKLPLVKAFGIDGIPATYLLDKSGKIASISARGPDLEAQVKKLLAEKK
jgi:thiol-disulfide isomerase/thioredoxin